MNEYNIDVIKDAIRNSSKESSIYIGCDSKWNRKKTIFGLVVIIHHDSRHGGNCWGKKIFDERKLGIKERLMKEVEMAVGCAFEVFDVIENRNFEIHLDINPNREHKSNEVMNQATGYVTAQGFPCQIKPNAWAASTCADLLCQ